MGVYLELQGQQLCFPQPGLGLIIAHGQVVDLLNHAVITAGKALDLHLVFLKILSVFLGFKPAQLCIQVLKGTGDDLGYKM